MFSGDGDQHLLIESRSWNTGESDMKCKKKKEINPVKDLSDGEQMERVLFPSLLAVDKV